MKVDGLVLEPLKVTGVQNKDSQIDILVSRFTYEKDRSIIITIKPPEIASDEEIEKRKKATFDALLKKLSEGN